ncbi:MAG: hypothetical protein ACO207_03460 [Bacilli bacterium]
MENHLNEDAILKYFEKQIAGESNQKIEEMQKDFSAIENSLIQKMDEELQAKYALKLELSANELKSSYELKSREIESKYRQNISKKRQSIIEKIFSGLDVLIHQYAESNDYLQYLNLKFQDFKLPDNQTIIITYNPKNALLRKFLSSKFQHATLHQDLSIRYGGFYLQINSQSFRHDFTLDSKVKQVQSEFYESGLFHG